MIRLKQIKLAAAHTEAELEAAIRKRLRIPREETLSYRIVKQSLDARKKDAICYLYVIDVEATRETEQILKKRLPKDQWELPQDVTYRYSVNGAQTLLHPPVVIGSGPAGLFCAYQLAKEGYAPVLLERGPAMETRVQKTEAFWNGGALDTEANAQFGEGGAGTFSDGKLNTLVKDKAGRGRYILDTFVQFGAPKTIAYLNKPHIGTDRLRAVITNLRKQIEAYGGTVRFGAKVTDFAIENGCLQGVWINETEYLACDCAVLAIGHSARDTFAVLQKANVAMEEKAFAVGLRVQHPRVWINQMQYRERWQELPSADYKVTHTCANGRGVYSFCMCPGGYVVNASSEPGRLAVNGMSNYDRLAENSNSAIIVTVTPEDYRKAMTALPVEANVPDVLAGVAFQRTLETLAYREGKGNIPTQRYVDFKENRASTGYGTVIPCTKGAVTYGNLRNCLPEEISASILEGMEAFDRKLPGFAAPDVLFCGVESRTSSPVRILRGETLESVSVKGLYPCGEGAGYAGGIMSAAMDGLRVFEAIVSLYTCAQT